MGPTPVVLWLLATLMTACVSLVAVVWRQLGQRIAGLATRVESLDHCIDRRFEGFMRDDRTMVAEISTLAERYAQLSVQLQVLRAEREQMHHENQDKLANLSQKMDGLLMSELQDLRVWRREQRGGSP